MQTLFFSTTLAITLASLVAGHVAPDGYETFPTAYDPHPSSSYKLHHEYKNWEAAKHVCSAEGGHLIIVNSQAEADIANTLITRTTVTPKKPKMLDQFHVGMHCKGHIGHWVTVKGGDFASTGWTHWAPNQPSPDYPRPVHCGALLRSMAFNNLACTFHLARFICEKPTITPAPPAPVQTPAPAPTPDSTPQHGHNAPDVYETFPSAHGPAESSYKLHRERVPWEIANAVCEREGAHLVVVNSDDEATVVAMLFGRLPPFNPASHRGYDVMHVGITDSHIEGQWLTVDGVSVERCGFNPWRQGEPDNRGGLEDCGGITRDKRLVDLDCIALNDSFPFICEKDLNDPQYDIDIRGEKRKH